MTNLGNFEPSENTGLEPLPAGKYRAAIIEDELRDNSKGTGQHLHLAWQILEGPFTGRQVFHNVNLKNDNPTRKKSDRGRSSRSSSPSVIPASTSIAATSMASRARSASSSRRMRATLPAMR
jgi:Protein of unknown function (DUF669)